MNRTRGETSSCTSLARSAQRWDKNGSHVGIIASFTIFVMFLIGTYFVIDPMIRMQKDKQFMLNYLESELSKEFSDNLTTAIISGDGCLEVNNSQVNVVSGGYAIAKKNDGSILKSIYNSEGLIITTNSATLVWVYYSPSEFNGGPTGPIYQEEANATNCNNQFCDGDWETHNDTICLRQPCPTYYFNYSVPNSAIGAKWKVKTYGFYDNFTIRVECWDASIVNNLLQLRVWLFLAKSYWNCWGGEDNGWIYPSSAGSGELNSTIYEEGIWWELDQGIPSECNVSEVKSVRDNQEFFEKRIIDGINDFENLTKKLSIPPGTEFSFSFEMENGEVLSAGEKNISGDVYAKEIPIQYIDNQANNLAGKLIIKVY